MSMPATSTKTTKLATSLIDEYALLGWRAMLTRSQSVTVNQASWIALTAVRTKIMVAGRFPPQRAGDSGLVTPFH